MNKTRLVLVVGLLAAALSAPPGSALHCNGEIITINAGAAILYMDDRSSGPEELHHWLYLESNGVDGLQSGGDNHVFEETAPPWSLLGWTDPCTHPSPDTLVV